MGIDRTSEFLSFCKDKPSELTTNNEGNVRRRHQKDRFAAEGSGSPSLKYEKAGGPDFERPTRLPRFLFESALLLKNIEDANSLLGSSAKVGKLSVEEFQKILNLCSAKLASLQELSNELVNERRTKIGWKAKFFGKSVLSQRDQHEATIIWFLNHRLSSLSKAFENYRSEMDKQEKESFRIRELRKTTSISMRPAKKLSPMSLPQTTVLKLEEFAEHCGISQDQMQMLSLENDELLGEYTETKSQIDVTQSMLNEVSRLQTTLQEQLLYQEAQIDHLYDTSQNTIETISKANTFLNRAGKRQSTSVRFFLWFMFVASLFVLLLHFISD